MFSLLSQLFASERYRPRAADVGFSLPALGEAVVGDRDIEPLLTTNMRGTFLRTRVSRESCVRYGFSECSLDQEPILLHELCKVLIHEGLREDWNNIASTIDEALKKLYEAGFASGSLVVPPELEFPETYEGVQVLRADLPCNAFVSAQPKVAGLYIRIGEHLSILAQRANAAFVMVL